jgi:hypothetical protein
VFAAYGRLDYLSSGWSFLGSTASLSLGQHTISATAVGPSGAASLPANKTITVQ